jgi:hypothetical protein
MTLINLHSKLTKSKNQSLAGFRPSLNQTTPSLMLLLMKIILQTLLWSIEKIISLKVGRSTLENGNSMFAMGLADNFGLMGQDMKVIG